MPGGSYPPLEVIESWPKPNYVDPETRGPALYITCVTMSVIGVLVVSLRLYARLVITKAPGVDDAIIVLALLLGVASSIIYIYGTEVLYIGYHVWDIPVSAYSPLRLNAWLSQWFVTAALASVKISLLLFYRRLSVTFSSTFLWATWIGIGYNVIYFITVALSISFECRPTAAYWLSVDPKWLADGHTYTCAHVEGVILPLYSAASVVGDFYSTTLPLFLVYSLQMSNRQKNSLYCLFGVGYTVVAAGIARTVFVNRVVNETYDTSWSYPSAALWVTVELYIAIMCASAPALKPFFKKYLVEPISIMTYESRMQHKSGHTFGSNGRKRDYIRNPSDTYLNETANDEESWTRDGVAVELSDFDKQVKDGKTGVTVQETGKSFHGKTQHDLSPNENRAGPGQNAERQQPSVDERYKQHQGAQHDSNNQYEHQFRRYSSQTARDNPTDRHSNNSEEPILDAPQILDNRRLTNSTLGQGRPYSVRVPPPLAEAQTHTPHGREASFVTISAFPRPLPQVSSRVIELDENIREERQFDFELPLQGTRENSPNEMKSVRPTSWHVRPESRGS